MNLRQIQRILAILLLASLQVTVCRAQEVDDNDKTPPSKEESSSEKAAYIDGKTYEERTLAFMKYCASALPKRQDYPKEAMAFYVSRLILNTDVDFALKKIDAAAAKTLKTAQDKLKAKADDPHARDPFDKHALLNAYLICRDKFPPATVEKIKQYVALYFHKDWRGYGAMNYRVMMDGSGFLAAELWPDLKDIEGLDAAGIKEATGKRLFGYFDEITHKNLGEYNAYIYFTTDMMAIRMLAEFARDPEMKRRAAMTLDWMVANIACSWNQGYYISSASRSKYWGSCISSPDNMDCTAPGWFYFGGNRPANAAHMGNHHSFWLAYPGTYKIPEILVKIAKDRTTPFVSREAVACMGAGTDIRKYTYQSQSYGLASQWEMTPNERSGIFKEEKRTIMKWVSDKPVSTFSVEQENFLRPYAPKAVTKNHFGYGENPYEQVVQHEGAQMAVYNVPANFPFYKMYTPFTKQGAIVKRVEKNGWIFCHGGSVLFAFNPVTPYTWAPKPQESCDILWCDARQGGWVLDTSELKPFAGGGVDAELDRFAAAVLSKCKLDVSALNAPLPSLKYTALSGHTLEIIFTPFGKPYTDQRKVDGKAVDYRSFPLMDNPWIHQEVNGDLLTLKHGADTLTLDFKEWKRKQ